MKKHSTLSLLCLLLFFSVNVYAQDGAIDPSFGVNGKAYFFVAGLQNSTNIVVLPNGKILQAGTAPNGANTDFVLVRWNQNGTPDLSFGDNGKVTTTVNDVATSLAVQADGSILVAGSKIVRYLADGSLDPSFGVNGIASPNLGPLNSIKVQSDGKIVGALAYVLNQPPYQYPAALIRLNSDGTLDLSYNGTGTSQRAFSALVFTNNNQYPGVFYKMALLPDDRIVTAGYANSTDGPKSAVVRYKTNGTYDSTFRVRGQITMADQYAKAVVVQGDNKTVALLSQARVYAVLGQVQTIRLTRLTSSGIPDGSFIEPSSDGYVLARRANDMKMQKDGKFVISGGSTADEFLALRVNTDGTLDNSFGTNGIQTVMMGISTDYAASLDFQGAYIILGGMVTDNFALTRLSNSSAIVLPLQLTNIDAKLLGGDGVLNWQTANEEATARFEVERSVDNRTYVRVGTVATAGHSSSPSTYSYTDKNVAALSVPVVYYRLKTVDSDGRYTYSKTVPVNISSRAAVVTLYPNPVRETATLQIASLQAETLRYSIVDASGRPVVVKTFNVTPGSNAVSIDTQPLSSGTYTLLLKGEQTTKEIKLVKQ